MNAAPDMQSVRFHRLRLALKLLTGALILRVTVSVVVRYRYYLPPDFGSDFLHGRESYFFGTYQWAFYAHIASGPCSLIFGLVLLSEQFRRRFPAWHRRLGKIQTACVLLLVSPSGAWMALHAETGAIAGAAFALMAAATAVCVWFGWRSAVKRRFAEHRRWMLRCFLLLCSAVVVRLIGGMGVVAGIHSDWAYPLGAWMSLLLPVGGFELIAGPIGRSLIQQRLRPLQS